MQKTQNTSDQTFLAAETSCSQTVVNHTSLMIVLTFG